jgi:hypothetical protein
MQFGVKLHEPVVRTRTGDDDPVCGPGDAPRRARGIESQSGDMPHENHDGGRACKRRYSDRGTFERLHVTAATADGKPCGVGCGDAQRDQDGMGAQGNEGGRSHRHLRDCTAVDGALDGIVLGSSLCDA